MINKRNPGRLNAKGQWAAFFLKARKGGILIAFTLLILLGFRAAEASDLSSAESKLVIHGFLSQGYANSSGGQIIGIPQDGTFNYRNAALQFRYNYSLQDAFVVQFSNSELGESPLDDTHAEVQLNWVFYQRRLLDMTSIKVGKFPVPYGIYNEILHVGTVLPFYRPPFNYYGDGAFSSETINGVGIYNTFGIGRDWSVEADFYAGEWIFLQQIEGQITPTRSRNILGGQFWLQTPIEGLRLGLGGNRSTDTNLPFPHAPSDEESHTNLFASLDANMENFIFQTEYFRSKLIDQDFRCYYGLAGVKLFEGKLGVNVMAEFANLTIPGYVDNLKYSKDYAVGVRYSIQPNLVVKAEQHFQKTFGTEAPVHALIDPAPSDVKYYIVSLAVSF
jgi:hypothetical protein